MKREARSAEPVDILGVNVDAVTRRELLGSLRRDLRSGRRARIVTVTNEIVMRAAGDSAYRKAVNAADYRIPDSAGTLWAATYLAKPLRGPLKRARLWTQAWWLLVWLAVWPSRAKRVITETVPGSELSLDLAALCARERRGLYLLGGGPGVADAAAARLRERFPKLSVTASGDDPLPRHDKSVRQKIKQARSQIVLLAYDAPDQVKWMGRNVGTLPTPVVTMGVGGTLDYIAGTESVHGGGSAKQPPTAIRRRGFEWLWRLVTQPSRWRRIVTAFPKFVGAVVRQKRTRLGL